MTIGVNHERIDVDLDDVRPCAHQAAERRGHRRRRLDVDRRRAAESMQQLRSLQLADLIDNLVFGQIGRHQPHVAKGLDPDAAQADHHDRAPSWIAARADDEFEPAWRHGFHQNAIELQARLRACHAGMQRRPRFAYGLAVGHAKDDTAGLRLVSELCGLRFHRHGIADAIGNRDRCVGAAGEFACRRPHAERGQHLLAKPFRLRALSEVRDRYWRDGRDFALP